MQEYFIALIGGLLIGVSATILMLFNGKIAGISGIIKGIIWSENHSQRFWQIAFIVGIIIGTWISINNLPELTPPKTSASSLAILISGLFVGIGTYLANGCTSGHGVCGSARLSRRSVTATMTFIACGVITVFIIQQF